MIYNFNIFIIKNLIGLSSSNLYHCTKCCLPRYTPCTRPNCINKPGRCFCNKKTRVSTNRVYYKSILMTIVKLLSIFAEGFIEAINCAVYHPPNCKYVDGTSGSTFKNAMREMKINFENRFGEAIRNKERMIISICLVLSFFYDGIQLYKSKVCKFSPALLTIMNLPDSFRNRLGIGK